MRKNIYKYRGIVFSITILFIILLTSFCKLSIYADNALTITVEENNTAVPGGTFTVDVSLSNNTGVSDIEFELDYESKYITLKDVTFASFITSDSETRYEVNSNKIIIHKSDGNFQRNGTYVRLTFELSSKATLGSYDITVKSTCKLSDYSGKNLKCSIVSGGVVIECYHNYTMTVYEATCSSEGFTEYHCSECSISYISDYKDRKDHTWKTKSTVDPTCTEYGSYTRYCKVCDTTETVTSGNPLGHSYDDGVVTEASCQHDGYTTYTCTRCGDITIDNYVSSVGHRYVKTYESNATCAETGYELYSCQYCGKSYTITLPTLEHQWKLTIVQASHKDGGWTLFNCLACGLSMRGNFTNPTDYDYIYEIVKKPTCTEDGLMIGVCSDGCGAEIYVTVPAVGHNYGEWIRVKKATTVSKGLWECTCIECGYSVIAHTDELDVIDDSVSEFYTIDFWISVVEQLFSSFYHVLLLVLIIAFVFVLILLIHFIKVYKIRVKTVHTIHDMQSFANEVSDAMKEAPPPPDMSLICGYDPEDYDLPDSAEVSDNSSENDEIM